MAKTKANKLNHATGFDVFLYIFMGLLALICFFPFYYMIIISFADYTALHAQTVYIVPTVFDTASYEMMFSNKAFGSSFMVTIFVTVVDTILGVIISVGAAYPLSKADLPGRKLMFNIMLFTMFFSGGMIPGYLVVENLGMHDSIWCMVWPCLVSQFNVILIKNYFEDLPASIEESAKIDGANDMTILFRIVLPMSTPIIATIALFVAVGTWNSYWQAMLHIMDNFKLPLQMTLRNMLMSSVNTLPGAAQQFATQNKQIYTLSFQMASVTIATIPILLVYPFVQKYFTKGIMLGGVKG